MVDQAESVTIASRASPDAGIRALNRLTDNMLSTLRLGAPVMVARAAFPAMLVVDSLMVARSGAAELGYLSLGLSIQFVLMMVAIGILQGALILTSQAIGSGKECRAGLVWRVALAHGLTLGIAFGVLSFATGPILLATGQTPAAVAGASRVALQFSWGMPGVLLYIACGYLLEAIGRPHIGMIIMLLANLANAGLNWIFVFGGAGLVAGMGAEGAILATSIVRWLIFFAAIAYILLRVDRNQYSINLAFGEVLSVSGLDIGRRLRRLGAPMGFTQAIESAAFQAIVLLAGLIGTAALAAHHVTMTYIQFIYMIAVGCAAATSIRVGRAVGKGDLTEVRIAGWAGMALVVCLMAIPAIVFVAAPEFMARIFIDDPQVLAIAQVSLSVLAALFIFDGLMGVSLGALRGAGDTLMPMMFHIAVFWALAVPLAWVFGFTMQWGAVGLTVALLIGVLASSAVLVSRFYLLTRRAIKQA